MLAAETIGGSLCSSLVFFYVCFCIIMWRLKKSDPEGKVKTAARDGLVRIIGRWLK